MRQPAPEHVKSIYSDIKALFGGSKPIVDRFGDDDEDPNWVDVMRTVDSPQPGVTSYATLGMSRFDNGGLEVGGKALRVELLASCQSEFTHLADGLVSCALNVAKDKWQVTPGVVHPNVLNQYRPDIVLKHLFLVSPFLWGGAPEDREFDDLVVTWLMAIPISDSEIEYMAQNGPERMESLFEEHQIDIFDINREPVV